MVSVSGPTRPYGSPFNYTGVQQLAQPEKSQYLAGMLSDIGQNNKTAQIIVGLSSDSQSQAAINTLLKLESTVGKLSLDQGRLGLLRRNDPVDVRQSVLPQRDTARGRARPRRGDLRDTPHPAQVRLHTSAAGLHDTLAASPSRSLCSSIVFYYILNLPILDFAPLFVVVTMLGVGIDYDIFFVTRIREEAMKGKSDDEAIKTALDKTWVTIFGLGLVLATVFSSFVVTGIALLEEIGFVVAAAVVIDVGIVILFFVPALMGIAERFNWWPSKLAKRQIVPEDPESEER